MIFLFMCWSFNVEASVDVECKCNMARQKNGRDWREAGLEISGIEEVGKIKKM